MAIDESPRSTSSETTTGFISMSQTLDYTHPLYLYPSDAHGSLNVGI